MVHQSHRVMPVGTDAVLLGAWSVIPEGAVVMDVGCGCGVIAMIVAHYSRAKEVDAIDASEAAVTLSTQNFQASNCRERLRADLQEWTAWKKTNQKKYDVLLCNPPFFEDDLLSIEANRRSWRHVEGLSWRTLVSGGVVHLRRGGKICFIIPAVEIEEISHVAEESGMYCTRYCEVVPKPGRLPNRCLVELTLHADEQNQEHTMDRHRLVVRTEQGHYHSDFKELTQDVYWRQMK